MRFLKAGLALFFSSWSENFAQNLLQTDRQEEKTPYLPCMGMERRQSLFPREDAMNPADIREIREVLGLSQEDLATILEVTRLSVSRYETGRQSPEITH